MIEFLIKYLLEGFTKNTHNKYQETQTKKKYSTMDSSITVLSNSDIQLSLKGMMRRSKSKLCIKKTCQLHHAHYLYTMQCAVLKTS